MYVPQLKLSVLCIPKCGTHTITEALESQFGKCAMPGHKSAAAHRSLFEEHLIVAFVREPWARFVSQINYNLGDAERKMNLDLALDLCLKPSRTVLMSSQASWIDKDTELWLFSELTEKLRDLGCETVGHENKGPTRWSLDDLKDSGRMDEIESFIAHDLQLWSTLNG